MTRRVFLHVGTPKSGTTYLQDRLKLNRDGIAQQGVTYLPTRGGDHFQAALDLIQERWAGELDGAKGQWAALVSEARRTRGDVLISHEILAVAKPAHVKRAMRDFADDEVHVIVTARDLARQIPAEWQEKVKHRGRRTFAEFLDVLVAAHAKSAPKMWFWRAQDLPKILTTWGSGLTPDRVHLVTVPTPGGPREALWERFGGVLGLDPTAPYADTTSSNASIGAAEVALLRRLNLVTKERKLPRSVYVPWVRELVVRKTLASRSSAPAKLDPRLRGFVDEVTERWLEWIQQSGVDIVGSVEDLRPVWPEHDHDWVDPDVPSEAEVADAAIEALASVLDEIARREAPEPSTVQRLSRRWRS